MIRTIGLALAALALFSPPAAMAQDIAIESETGTVEEPATPPTEPQGTYILAASDRFLALYGSEGWLDPELEICLEEGEQVQLGQTGTDIATMELRGALCTRVADAGDVATIVVERAPVRPTRTAATRGATSRTASASAPIFRVATGTGDVLSKFPAGTRVTQELEICLARGQQITLISSRGQRVTYRGPGCARRNARPSATNQGGFTFGWNGLGGGRDVAVLP